MSNTKENKDKARHTPGPWSMVLCDNESAWMVGPRETNGSDYVADVHKLTSGRSDADSEANARLIAAAPELLEACEDVVRDILEGELVRTHPTYERGENRCECSGCATLRTLHRVIAKAKGE